MDNLEVELLVIGWGKAGKTLAKTLGAEGGRVALVEQSDQMYGGSCINIACVPTKALVHEADGRRADDDSVRFFADAQAFRNDLTAKLRAANFRMLDALDEVVVLNGKARFVDDHTVEVRAGADVMRIRAEVIVVNTGSLPAAPELPGMSDSRVHTSESLQYVDPLPARLAVVGDGVVGLEFADMFARFGSRVTVLSRGARILPHEDEDVAEAVQDAMTAAGVSFVHGAHVSGITGDDHAITVQYGVDGRSCEAPADAVLMATGRRPATTGLGLAAASVSVDERGAMIVDEYLRSSTRNIFAVGDVNGGPQFTYISYDDHRIVLDQLTGAGARSTRDRVAVPRTTFLTPPFARVGFNERQARVEGRAVRVAAKKVADIATMPRPKIVRETRGLIKFVVDAETDLVLGATLFCVDAQEMINTVALAMRAGVTASQLRDGIWTHPSTTESFNEVLGDLRDLPL